MSEINVKRDFKAFPTCNFTLDEKMYAVMADQNFYNYIGSNVNSKLDKIVYEDDMFYFKTFFNQSEIGSSVIVRILVNEGFYRYVVIELLNVTRTMEDKDFYEFQMHDVLTAISKYEEYSEKIKKYRAIINQIDSLIFEYDYDTQLFKAYRYVHNYSELIEKQNIDEWIADQINKKYIEEPYIERFRNIATILKSGMENFSLVLKTSILSKGERDDTLKISGQCIYDGTLPKLYVGTISEISVRIREGNVTFDVSDSDKDPGTGVLNKKAVTEKIKSRLKEMTESGAENAYFMLIDIDNFKYANDTFGHLFGDEVIRTLAGNAQKMLKSEDVFGRTGGDEFIALLSGYDEQGLRTFIKTLRNSVGIDLATKNKTYYFSMSIGISTFSRDGMDYDSLFKIADVSLYMAKEKGKDRFILYEEERHKESLERFEAQIDAKEEYIPMVLNKFVAKNSMDLTLDWVFRLEHEKLRAIKPVLTELLENDELDGITIFAGKNYKNILSVGDYKNPAKDLNFLSKDRYKDFFSEEKINRVSTAANVDSDYEEMIKIICDNSIRSFVQVKVAEGDDTEYIVEFDICGHNKRKWNNDDITTFYIISKTIGDVLN